MELHCSYSLILVNTSFPGRRFSLFSLITQQELMTSLDNSIIRCVLMNTGYLPQSSVLTTIEID